MANLCAEFETFYDRIALTKYNLAALGITRDGYRQNVRRYFRQTLNVRAPKFGSQGPFAANIMVCPINGEHHIEEGVYLQHLDRQSIKSWPSADVVYQWLVDAAPGIAELHPDSKRGGVMVHIANQLYLHLYCYADLNGKYFQATKSKAGWSGIHPLADAGWFRSYVNQYGEQLRRIVRYIAAWADFQSEHRGQMSDGFMLTVLATYNFNHDYRDDLSLAKTLEAISDCVRSTVYVLNPVNINEELSARLTDMQKTRLQQGLEEAANTANAAVTINDAHIASKLWRKLFGGRFPLVHENHGYALMIQNLKAAAKGLGYIH